MVLLVKSGQEATALVFAIRGIVASIDKQQPIFRIATMQEVVNASVSTRRLTLILLGLFSGLQLVLAGIGIYGAISYSVAQFARGIGSGMGVGRDAVSPHPADASRYPPLARNARIQGVVDLSAIIDKDGKAKSATLIEGHPLLAPAALDAVKNWVYEPTLFNGEPQRSRRCKRHGVNLRVYQIVVHCRNDCTTIRPDQLSRMIRRTPIRRCAQQRQRG